MAEKSIGAALREIRERQGVSIVSVARRAGISDAMLSRIERGERQSPHFTTMVKIASALGVSLDGIAQDAGLAGARPRSMVANAAASEVALSVSVDAAVRYLEKALEKLKATYPTSRRGR